MMHPLAYRTKRFEPDARNSPCDMDKRGTILHRTLVDGPAWEPNTADVVMKVSKKGFKPKRVGAKAAKALEFESKGEILNQSEATLFRALAARANYLAMDRPECAYATKELCRFFSTPTKTGVEQLKKLIRYLASAPRLVWHFGTLQTSMFSLIQISLAATLLAAPPPVVQHVRATI